MALGSTKTDGRATLVLKGANGGDVKVDGFVAVSLT
jgi:hypothetical protein